MVQINLNIINGAGAALSALVSTLTYGSMLCLYESYESSNYEISVLNKWVVVPNKWVVENRWFLIGFFLMNFIAGCKITSKSSELSLRNLFSLFFLVTLFSAFFVFSTSPTSSQFLSFSFLSGVRAFEVRALHSVRFLLVHVILFISLV